MKELIKKTTIILLFFLLGSMNLLAIEVTVGSLKYTLNGNNATVSGYVAESLPQDLVIPQEIEYNNMTFTVNTIDERVFKGCNQLKTVTLPYTVTKILGSSYTDRGGSFSHCSNLEKVILSGIEYIEDYAFYGCTKLKCVDFGSRLKSIGRGNFGQCSSLTYLVLPSSLSDVFGSYPTNYYNPFDGCYLLQNIIYLGNNSFNLGLSNVNIYHPRDFVSFDNNVFVYSGYGPVPIITNNLPAGFVPAADMSTLEKDAGTYTQNIPFTFTNDDMSFNVDIPYTYTINPARLTAKVKDASRLYGDGNPEFTSTYTGFVNGEDASVVTSNGSYTTTATAKSDVGTYAITQSGATAQNYVFEYEDGTLTVNKAPLTIIANDKTMKYGGAVPALDARYEGLKNNETQPAWNNYPSISTTATPSSKVGTYPITISNAVPKNYELTINNGTITVAKANLNVKVNNKTKTYGEANPEFTLSYTGLKNNETEPEWEIHPTFETLATIQSGVGTYPISVTNAVAVNYNLTISNGTLSINKATLTAKANNTNREYGEDNPSFNVTYLGFVCDDDETALTTSPNMSTSATKASNVGEYPIIISGGAATNYNIVYESGVLTVTKAPLSAMVNDATKVYGANNPSFTISYYGLKNGETAPAWTTSPTFQTEATKRSGVGQYTVNAINGVPKNYDLGAITPGTLTITPAPLTIKANNAVRQYYTDNPTFSYTCNGFVNNENNSILSPVPTLSTTATQTSNVGTYEVSAEGAASTNYTISYVSGTLTITPRTLIASVGNYSRPYNEENPEFEVLYSGFVGSEDESVLNEAPVASTTATRASDVGTYQINVTGGSADNYTFSYSPGTLTINKAEQTITWNQDFSNAIIIVGDQVELKAQASSGLPVTYTVSNSNIAEVYTAGSKTYLDCFGLGQVQVLAVQEGNKNYYSSPRVRKVITIDNDDAISSIDESEVKIQSSSFGVKVTGVNKGEMVRVYTVDGKLRHSIEADSQSIDIPLKKGGIYIIQFKDGTKKKVLIK